MSEFGTGKVSSPNRRQGLRIYGWRWRRWKRLRIQSARRARGQLRPAPPEAARIYGTPPARATRFYVISVASGSVTRAVAGRPSTSVISRRCCSIAAGGRITRASISPPGHSAITPVSDCLRLIDPEFHTTVRRLRRNRNGREGCGREQQTDDCPNSHNSTSYVDAGSRTPALQMPFSLITTHPFTKAIESGEKSTSVNRLTLPLAMMWHCNCASSSRHRGD